MQDAGCRILNLTSNFQLPVSNPMPIHLKRAYDEPEESDGCRVLVDRIWPRGDSKEQLQLDAWMKEVAPSDDLRKWFDHDPEKFEEFRERYQAELSDQQDKVERLKNLADHQDITLVYSAKDRKHNQAVVLKDYLEKNK